MNEGNKPRVTIDTNLVFSGTIIPDSIPSKILSLWVEARFDWIITEEIYIEIRDVLHRKHITRSYHINKLAIQSLLTNLESGAEFIIPLDNASLPVYSRDPKDDKFLACAFGGNCDYLVTGDKDLLVLQNNPALDSLTIIPAGEFVKILLNNL